ncbi:hypothetical protein LshimejAT787_1500090 [Lyophyllum shimeji]|uniref:Protein kinase domain-containing protein n=1 Tax=Lyophyllum shimeji TaxID=47721 RepID=A0A9P3UTP1_LYOSH|nr:hypothetical protein LshimejAT787_1500090 [Lyophyllum shimeji]
MPDGRISIQLTRNGVTRTVPVLINEEKPEGAKTTTDATTQASFSMIRAWSDPELEVFRNLACCPTFLLGFSGCHLVISAAVLTDKCIVERLATMWVGHSTTHGQNHIEDVWYEGVIVAERPLYEPNTVSHPQFFPHAHRYPLDGEDFSGDTVEFEYQCPLQSPRCVSPSSHGPRPIMGKKASRSSLRSFSGTADLHRFLEEWNMAPALRYCGQIDESTPYSDWQMLVMDYFDGRPSYQNDAHRLREVYDVVVKAVDLAHQEDFVFGDLRPPNVLINGEGEIRLIDFEWAGKEGQVRYPAYMSTMLWVDGVGLMAAITKAHDLVVTFLCTTRIAPATSGATVATKRQRPRRHPSPSPFPASSSPPPLPPPLPLPRRPSLLFPATSESLHALPAAATSATRHNLSLLAPRAQMTTRPNMARASTLGMAHDNSRITTTTTDSGGDDCFIAVVVSAFATTTTPWMRRPLSATHHWTVVVVIVVMFSTATDDLSPGGSSLSH